MDTTRRQRPRVVVVGAGIAGLTAATRLSRAAEVIVLDKGRGVGGRVATRRIGEATFDYGAQFLTTHTDEFAATVQGWQQAGVVTPWFHGRIGPAGLTGGDAHARFRGAPSMNAIAKHLAAGLLARVDVRRAVRVTSLRPEGGRWAVDTENAGCVSADVVLLTPPVPQSLELLAAGGVRLAPSDAEALGTVRYDPCLALLVPLEGPSGLAEPAAIDPDDGPIDWLADNQVKGVSTVPAVTIHASADYTRDHWTAPVRDVAEDLLAVAGLGSPPVGHQVQLHRWRSARPTVLHPTRCLVAADTPPLVFAGDAFGGAKVEGAALSGAAAAAEVARILASPSP